MDVADRAIGGARVKDELAERCQKLFQDFLEEWEKFVFHMQNVVFIVVGQIKLNEFCTGEEFQISRKRCFIYAEMFLGNVADEK